MNLKIGGDKSRLQSSLDFYLKITSMSEYKNIEALRKGMFSKFMEEERSRESSYLALSREDDAIELAREREERLEGELFDGDIVGHGRYLEEYEIKEEGSLEEVELIEETEDFEVEESVSSGKGFLEAVRSAVQVREEEPLEVEELEGFEVEEPTMGSKSFLDAVKSIESRVSEERVEHGRYLEDYVEVEESEDDGFESVQPDVKDSIERVDHGKYLEDYVEEEVEEEEEPEDSDFVEEVEVQPEGTNDYEEEEEENIEDAIEDISDWMDSLFSSLKKDESVVEEKEEVVEESKKEVEVVEEKVEEPKGNRFEEDSILDKNEKNGNSEIFTESIQQPTQSTEMSFKQEEVEEELSEKEEIIVKPANIRDFLRQHPNSSIEFVMKYYSKKEIDKALALGKIYKKKGKLMI